MSKKSRPWNRRQRKAIRRRTKPPRWYLSEAAIAAAMGHDVIAEVARWPRLNGTFTGTIRSDAGDLFAVRPTV